LSLSSAYFLDNSFIALLFLFYSFKYAAMICASVGACLPCSWYKPYIFLVNSDFCSSDNSLQFYSLLEKYTDLGSTYPVVNAADIGLSTLYKASFMRNA